jgi:hypothetical protein
VSDESDRASNERIVIAALERIRSQERVRGAMIIATRDLEWSRALGFMSASNGLNHALSPSEAGAFLRDAKDMFDSMRRNAILEEREACATIAEEHHSGGHDIARLIRRRE